MTRLNLCLVALAAVGLCTVFVGCSDAPYAGKNDTIAPGAYPNIAVEEHALRSVLKFGSVAVQPSTDRQPMRVTATVRNTADKDLKIQYRYEFMDASGRPLQTNQGWQYMPLPQRIECSLDGSAMETSAAGWRLVVRSSQ